MKGPIAILSIFLLSVFSCGRWIDFGEETKDARSATIEEITADPPAFANDTVRVGGILKRSAGWLTLNKGECSIPILPVGFDVPDSAMGGKAFAEGMVFYHEELQTPGIAAGFLTVQSR